jgi:hypothetical protein
MLVKRASGQLPIELTYSIAVNRTMNPTRYRNEMKRMWCGLPGSREW